MANELNFFEKVHLQDKYFPQSIEDYLKRNGFTLHPMAGSNKFQIEYDYNEDEAIKVEVRPSEFNITIVERSSGMFLRRIAKHQTAFSDELSLFRIQLNKLYLMELKPLFRKGEHCNKYLK